jgi:thiol-disulfide isomerase/thioredoxin
MKTFLKVAGHATLAIFGASIALAQSTNSAAAVDGRWDASLTSQGTVIPFRLDISGSGPTLKGTLYDGSRPNDGTSSATFENNKLVLKLDQYQTAFIATLQDGKLTGNVISTRAIPANAAAPKAADASANETDETRLTKVEFEGSSFAATPFEAVRHVDVAVEEPKDVPQIGGSWIIPLSAPSAKGENAFRFIVEQKGAYVEASILRVDGDTGAYSGNYKDGKWVLSHYDGGRPGVIEVSQASDGSLEIVQKGGLARRPVAKDGSNPAANRRRQAAGDAPSANNDAQAQAGPSDVVGTQDSGRYSRRLIAYRPDVEKAKGLPEPDDYTTHTGIRDPNEIFKFKFPDDQGNIISNEDARFKGKPIIAMVTGTWCPNCHDEAQYLVQLYAKYHSKGLEIVALDFEEPDQQKGLSREKAFIKHYGVKYPYLIAGDRAQVWEKIPQFVKLNSWPTIIFIGRDGKVKATHTGFASPASGEFYRQLDVEFRSNVEKLLAEKAPQNLAAASAAPGKSGQ